MARDHTDPMTRTESIATVLWLREHSLWHVVRNWIKTRRMTGAEIAGITTSLHAARRAAADGVATPRRSVGAHRDVAHAALSVAPSPVDVVRLDHIAQVLHDTWRVRGPGLSQTAILAILADQMRRDGATEPVAVDPETMRMLTSCDVMPQYAAQHAALVSRCVVTPTPPEARHGD